MVICCTQGGELIVEFGDQQKVFDFEAANGWSACSTAFYAGTALLQSLEHQHTVVQLLYCF